MTKKTQPDSTIVYTNTEDIIAVGQRIIETESEITKGVINRFTEDALIIGREDGQPVDIDAQELRKKMGEILTQNNVPDNRPVHEKTIVFVSPVRLHNDGQSLFAPITVQNDIDDLSDEYERYYDLQYFKKVDTKISFKFDDSLTLVDTTGLTSMREMFNGCTSANYINVSEFNTENVTDMHAMFANTAIRKTDISNFETDKVTDMSEMFSDCDYLWKLKMGDISTNSLETANKMFNGCRDLSTIDNPSKELGQALAKLDKQPGHDCEFDKNRVLHTLSNVQLATKADTIMNVTIEGQPKNLRHIFYGKPLSRSVDVSWEADGNRYDKGHMQLTVSKVNALRDKAEAIERDRTAAMQEILPPSQNVTMENQPKAKGLGE